jgi:cytochrome d ubiquinol oxidase subunit I
LYLGLGVTTVLILRNMSRRFRGGGVAEQDVPYGPSDPVQPAAQAPEEVALR